MDPQPGDSRALMMASFCAAGDERGVARVLAADPGAVNELGLDGTTPLCAAAMWGHTSLCRTLLEAMAAPGLRNESGPRWTPLHAAALQEHGKVCMLLLDFNANPMERDTEGVTPCDYASCSEGVWPLFAARGCERVAKASLVERGVLRRASTQLESELQAEASTGDQSRRGVIPEYSRPGSAYVLTREFPPRPGSSMGSARPPSSRPSSRRTNSMPIDILEEEEQGATKGTASGGLKSLGI